MLQALRRDMIARVLHEPDREQRARDYVADPEIERYGPKTVESRQIAGQEGRDADREVAGNSFRPTARPRRRGPTRSTFIMTVIDQESPWFIPSSTLAATIHRHSGAHDRNGSGSPTQPSTSVFLRPQLSASCPETWFVTALTMPKLTMKEVTATVEASWNCSQLSMPLPQPAKIRRSRYREGIKARKAG